MLYNRLRFNLKIGTRFFILLSIFLFGYSARAQQFGQQFYSLMDNGGCTLPISQACPTFRGTCAGGWSVSNGTPELIPTTGWSCSEPCVQGSANCDATSADAILMVGIGALSSEGVYKSFYFQKGLTYQVCVFYSMTPLSPTGGGSGTLTFAAYNGLIQPLLRGCQSAPPTVTPSQLIGTASSSQTFASFTFNPQANFSQFLMFATAATQQYTAVVTGVDITVEPVCATPAITFVSSNGPGQINVTWTAVTGVRSYLFQFSDGTNTGTLGYSVPQIIPTAPFPATYSNTFQSFPSGTTYTVSVQANIDAACSGGSSPWSAPSNPITISCLGGTFVEMVEPVSGGAFVAWESVAGATSYNVDFLSGSTVVRSFNSTITNPQSGATFTGVPPGTYTIAVQGVASCGTGPLAYYTTPITVN